MLWSRFWKVTSHLNFYVFFGNVLSVFQGRYAIVPMILRNATTPFADNLPHVFDVMRKHKVKRFIALSSPAFIEPKEQLPISYRILLLFYGAIWPVWLAESRKMAKIITKQDDIDWTLLRILHVTDLSENYPVMAGKLDAYWNGSSNSGFFARHSYTRLHFQNADAMALNP